MVRVERIFTDILRLISVLGVVAAQTAAPMLNRWGHSMVATRKGIYVLNGFSVAGTEEVGNFMIEYQNLELRPPVAYPFKSLGHHSCVFEPATDEIFCFGGTFIQSNTTITDQSQYQADLMAYNTITDKWRVMKLNGPELFITNHESVIVGERMYIYGRTLAGTADLWEIDHLSAAPIIKPVAIKSDNNPAQRTGHCVVPRDDHSFIMMFGRSDTMIFNDTWIFDTQKSAWTEVLPEASPALPLKGRSGAACAIVGDKVYVFGGSIVNGNAVGLTNQVISLELSKSLWNVVGFSALMGQRTGLSSATAGQFVVLQGGKATPSTLTSEPFVWDAASERFVTVSSIPIPTFTDANSRKKKALSTPVLIGIIVGAVAFVALIAGGFFVLRRQKKKSMKKLSTQAGAGLKGIKIVSQDEAYRSSEKLRQTYSVQSQVTHLQVPRGQAEDVRVCIADFEPRETDELEMHPGDKLSIEKVFEDGWAQAVNLNTGEAGVIPVSHVKTETEIREQSWIAPTYNQSIMSYSRESAISSRRESRMSSRQPYSPAAHMSNVFKSRPGDRYIVIVPYIPAYDDEIALTIEDEVVITNEFADGWCKGINIRTGATGVFPKSSIATVPAEEIEMLEGPVTPEDLLKIAVKSAFVNGRKSIASRPTSGMSMQQSTADKTLDVLRRMMDGERLDDVIGSSKSARTVSMHKSRRISKNQLNQTTNSVINGSKQGLNHMKSVIQAHDEDFAANDEFPIGSTVVARYDFKPSMEDEIVIKKGDMIKICKTYEDGWCIGENMRTQKTGFFPKNVLQD